MSTIYHWSKTSVLLYFNFILFQLIMINWEKLVLSTKKCVENECRFCTLTSNQTTIHKTVKTGNENEWRKSKKKENLSIEINVCSLLFFGFRIRSISYTISAWSSYFCSLLDLLQAESIEVIVRIIHDCYFMFCHLKRVRHLTAL